MGKLVKSKIAKIKFDHQVWKMKEAKTKEEKKKRKEKAIKNAFIHCQCKENYNKIFESIINFSLMEDEENFCNYKSIEDMERSPQYDIIYNKKYDELIENGTLKAKRKELSDIQCYDMMMKENELKNKYYDIRQEVLDNMADDNN
ncbi:hypothetical protein HX088_11220 [Empedobacter sp. 225-1]|uniref:hypothetical protein n=1 Tax=Empedobacter sp. 225-1 TaxID=2746725 RepID=UPI002575948C|nr:hypothetical protein [Empedobacter sp. 225-1]MDM1523836.1 hypothetical protein [Empedobacter sp. 225-1]